MLDATLLGPSSTECFFPSTPSRPSVWEIFVFGVKFISEFVHAFQSPSLTLCFQLIVFYVIIGLAVITASLDLCSATLKRTFTKLHYFGRKIRGARKGFANMSDDIREAMKIIAALKKTRFAYFRTEDFNPLKKF